MIYLFVVVYVARACLDSEVATATGCIKMCLHSYYNSTTQSCIPFSDCKTTHILNTTTNTCIPDCNRGRPSGESCICDSGWDSTETSFCSSPSPNLQFTSSDDFWFFLSLISMFLLFVFYILIKTYKLHHQYKRNVLKV